MGGIKKYLLLFTLLMTILSVNAIEEFAVIEDGEANSVEEIVVETKSEEIAEIKADETQVVEEKFLDALYDKDKAIYSIETGKWYLGEPISDDDIVLTKKLFTGTGAYSQYYYPDGTLAISLCSGYEFVKDGLLVIVNNENLTYSKLVYSDGVFEEAPIEFLEIQTMFPETQLVRLSLLDSDNKMWVHKPLFKKKSLFFINDTDKYYYNLTAKVKSLQPTELRSFVVLSHYGFYTFTHFGERNGKIRLYVR